jgi:hypothetical protein
VRRSFEKPNLSSFEGFAIRIETVVTKGKDLQRITVIGSGATALSVLDVVASRPGVQVTLIRPERRLQLHRVERIGPAWNNEAFVAMIRSLRRELGLKFPPPKTHFGNLPEVAVVRDWGQIWRSNLHGGLTQFWGASMVPFTDRELGNWPLRRVDLEEDYWAVAERVGITGLDDALRGYFNDGFAVLPPIKTIAPIKLLIDRLAHHEGQTLDVLSGASRMGVETRPNRPNACVYSGDCMSGCSRGAVFSALPHIETHVERGTVVEEHLGMAHRIDLERKRVHVRSRDGCEIPCDYDQLFVCAGTVQSVELLMRSCNIEAEATISDNMLVSFPVFFGGRLPSQPRSKDYFALTNGLMVIRPRGPNESVVFVQLYPNPDYFWQFNLPVWLWRFISPLAERGRNRLFWARASLPSSQSQHYQVSLEENGAVLNLDRKPDLAHFSTSVFAELRRALSHAGFWVPPVLPIPAKTSSHYAGGFPMGGQLVNSNGAIGNGAYLCDSASFPDCPATSPTFTTMANARRIARRALA